MENTKTVAVAQGTGINGNIGSCSLNETDVTVSVFEVRSMAVNSCDGSIISDKTHIGTGWIIGLALLIAITTLIMTAIITDNY